MSPGFVAPGSAALRRKSDVGSEQVLRRRLYMGGILALFPAVLMILGDMALGSDNGSAQTGAQPSFPCASKLSKVETMICADEELSAYDAAMAIFYRHRPRKGSPFISITHSDWLKRRNACADRSCVLARYKEWIYEFDGKPPWTHERRWREPDGSDLMLGTLQSPTGKVKTLGNIGNLYIQRLGGDWYAFSAFAVYYYDPHDGLGPNFSDAGATGVVRLPNGRGVWTAGGDDPCEVQFRRVNQRAWALQETGRCSGLGATLDGVYHSNR
jgi:hypothetical protein